MNAIVRDIEPILISHKKMLLELAEIGTTWDSRHPNLAKILCDNVDNFKLSVTFLLLKEKHIKNFNVETAKNPLFARAVKEYESKILNDSENYSETLFGNMTFQPAKQAVCNSGFNFAQHLNLIHQNLLRYKLFVETYAKLLDPSSFEEIALTKMVHQKLINIYDDINYQLNAPERVSFCNEIYQPLKQLNFDIFKSQRKLIANVTVLKQSRKICEERQLILVSFHMIF